MTVTQMFWIGERKMYRALTPTAVRAHLGVLLWNASPPERFPLSTTGLTRLVSCRIFPHLVMGSLNALSSMFVIDVPYPHQTSARI